MSDENHSTRRSARFSWVLRGALVVVLGMVPVYARAQALFVLSVQQDPGNQVLRSWWWVQRRAARVHRARLCGASRDIVDRDRDSRRGRLILWRTHLLLHQPATNQFATFNVAIGAVGPIGPAGVCWPGRTSGADGVHGSQGATGSPGPSGPTGPAGTQA